MIYAIPVGIAGQRELITKHCFGDCGKISVGAILDETMGEFAACRYEDCPHVAMQLDRPSGTIFGEEIFLRRLK